MLNIKLNKLEYMNCYEGLIISYAMHCNRNYEMMFTGSWGFKYFGKTASNTSKLGHRISTEAKLKWDYFERYHGIRCVEHSKKTPDEILTIIEKQLENGNPSLIFVTNYWFPWNEHYKKLNNGLYHAIMVKGIDTKNNFLYCLDATFVEENALLSIDDFKNGCNDICITLECLDSYDEKIDWKEALAYSINKVKRGTEVFHDFEDMRRFSSEVRESLVIREEIEDSYGGIWVEPIIFEVTGLACDRVNYCRALEYMAYKENIPVLKEISKKIKKIVIDWEKIRGMIIKGYHSTASKELLIRIADKISKAADDEEKIANMISEFIGFNEVKLEVEELQYKNEKVEKEINEYLYVNLENEFNNHSFGDYSDKNCTANISGLGYFLYIDDSLKERVWSTGQMKFNFPEISCMSKDSISCMGQNINLPNDYYDTIMFMGFADLGSFSEEAFIEYVDGTKQTLLLQFSEHSSQKVHFGESIIWNGKYGYLGKKEEAYSSKIYAKSYNIDSNKMIKSINLPVCPNIIIFSISLGREGLKKKDYARRGKHEIIDTCK